MYQENEIVTLLITLGIGFFFWANRKSIVQVQAWYMLLVSYLFYFVSTCFTVLEGYIWPTALNLLEHLFILLFSIVFLLWCWQIGYRKEKNQ